MNHQKLKRISISLIITFFFCATLSYGQYDFSQDRFMRNQNVQVMELSKNGKKYGHAVFLLRGKSPRIKAKYFAKNAYQAFLNWRSNKNIILISSGAYSTGWNAKYDTPVGLCVDNGNLVNLKIEDKMDGLVIVEAVGGVRVSDIDNNDLYLKSLGKEISPRRDKMSLVNWGKREDATIFQTHLLAFKNNLRIDPYKSSSSVANRRFLVLGHSGGSLFHAIFHITKNVSLHEATNDVMKTLQDREINVVSVLNLDTGGYDILEVYDDKKRKIPYIKGTKDKSTATNLLIYYYD